MKYPLYVRSPGIQLSEVNAQTAFMAETAVARVVRLSWARAHLPVAGSSMPFGSGHGGDRK